MVIFEQLKTDSSTYVEGSNVGTNTLNAPNTNDIFFQSNNASFAQFDFSEDTFKFLTLMLAFGVLKRSSLDNLPDTD